MSNEVIVYMKRRRNNKKKNINEIINEVTVEKDIDIRKVYEDANMRDINRIPITIREDKAYRLLVNGIRHEHTNYENNLKNVYHICNSRYYNLYKNTVLNNISTEYPYLSEECNKQLQGRVVAIVVK